MVVIRCAFRPWSPAAGALLAIATGLAGCAAEQPSRVSPDVSLAAGSCGQLKSQLARYEQRGTHLLADRAGRNEVRLSPAQKSDVAAYNAVLGRYLGGRCHA